MSNECYNTLTIVGHNEDLYDIYMQRLDFDYFVPTPNVKDRLNNWGTTCLANPESIRFELGENWLQIKYDTPSNPPYIFLEKLLDIYHRCWMKNESITDDYHATLYILYKKAGVRQEKILVWDEPEPRVIAGEIIIF